MNNLFERQIKDDEDILCAWETLFRHHSTLLSQIWNFFPVFHVFLLFATLLTSKLVLFFACDKVEKFLWMRKSIFCHFMRVNCGQSRRGRSKKKGKIWSVKISFPFLLGIKSEGMA